MIKWYDWIVAFITADLLLSNIMLLGSATIWWHQFAASIAILFLWDFWHDGYCKFRKMVNK